MNVTVSRILLTGGSGFMASNVVARLAPLECHIVRIRRPGSPVPPDPTGLAKVDHVEGDIRERSFWGSVLPGADVVYHFAAQTSVYTADQNPVADWQANVLPMLALLETCREQGSRPLIVFAGTATQCGLSERTPVDETHPDRPVTIYDWHKLAAETYLEHYVRQGWASGVTLRLANVYGPGPASGKTDRGVLNLMICRALKGEALTLYGTGEQLRDYLFVTDAVDAFLAAAAHREQVNGRHFVLSSGEGHTLAQAFRLIAQRAVLLTGVEPRVIHVAPPAGLSRIEDRRFVGDITRLREATGWQPRTSLQQGIDVTLKAFQS